MQFHHLGIVAASAETGKRHLENLLGPLSWTPPIEDPLQQVSVSFATDVSGVRYEVIVPLAETSPIMATLRSKKNILNHVAYRTGDFEGDQRRLRAAGHMPLGSALPATAFAGMRIQFHLNPLGFIVELIEDPVVQNTTTQSD